MAFDSKGTLNKVMLIGRLGQDPELRYTPSNAAVLTLNIATNTSYRGQDGNNVENTEWHRVVVWRKLAEIMHQYAKKGSRVYVEGKLVTKTWQDKDGVKRYTTEIQAENMQLLESKSQDSSAAHSDDSQVPPSEPDFQEPDPGDSDDLPF